MLYKDPSAASEWFARYDESVTVLKKQISEMVRISQQLDLHKSDGWSFPTESDAWKSLMEKHEDYQAVGPLLIATLYGPTGGGKSAIFRLLTGCAVPSGEVPRPVSYASAVATPAEITQDIAKMRRIFRDRPVELILPEEMEKLRSKNNSGKIFVISMDQSAKGLPWALADVPDFNSVEKQNWEESQYILRHAHVALFVVFQEAYADEKVVQELERCCELASRVIYVLTKVESEEQAQQIWEDLLVKLAQRGSRRSADGMALSEILRKNGFYYSIRYGPNPPEPGTEDWDAIIRPGREGMPSFSSLLRGLEAQRLVLQGLLLPVPTVIQECRRFLEQLDQKQKQLKEDLQRSYQPVEAAAQQVAGAEYPLGEFMSILYQEVQSRGIVFRGIARVVGLVSSLAPKQWLRNIVVAQPSSDVPQEQSLPQDKLIDRKEFEKKKLQEALENPKENKGIFIAWRSMFPEQCKPGGLLSQDRWMKIREEFGQFTIPEPTEAWESYARSQIQQWIKDHPWRARWMWVLKNVSELGVLGAIVLDLTTTGGIVGSLGLTAAAGAGGSLAARMLLSWAEKYQLDKVMQNVDEKWRQERSVQFRAHLEKHLWEPVFAPWQKQLAELENLTKTSDDHSTSSLQMCQSACNQLEALAGQFAAEETTDDR